MWSHSQKVLLFVILQSLDMTCFGLCLHTCTCSCTSHPSCILLYRWKCTKVHALVNMYWTMLDITWYVEREFWSMRIQNKPGVRNNCLHVSEPCFNWCSVTWSAFTLNPHAALILNFELPRVHSLFGGSCSCKLHLCHHEYSDSGNTVGDKKFFL